MKNLVFLLTLCLSVHVLAQKPYLKTTGNTTQLMVDGQPFLIRGGELGNSTASTIENMKPVWEKLTAMNLNTVLIPIYWELIEPKEGEFDFKLVNDLILEARQHDLKVVPLWFGSWKNSMSSHAPSWVKLDQERFPRVKDDRGQSQEILSPFSQEVLEADKKAFVALMEFIKRIDEEENTVIMVQVENEIGMLPSARDHQALAQKAFEKNVPKGLTEYLKKNQEVLVPEFASVWKANGAKTWGNWEEIFGANVYTDESFMAYYYSVFTNDITAAGKAVYDLPMYVNAALNRTGREPGEYPSAGPLPHLMDVWKAGGTAIDFLSPDFYNPDFKHWCDLYARQHNPLFVPEHGFDETVAAKALYLFGHYQGLGFSPFHIEKKDTPEEEDLGKAYTLVENISHLIHQKNGTSQLDGVLLSKAIPGTKLRMGDYLLHCKNDYTLSWTPGARTNDWPLGGAIIIQTAPNEFFVSGTGVVVTFEHVADKNLNVGLLKVDEGSFDAAQNWVVKRHLNGDQTHQGRHVSIPTGSFQTQRVELYTYK
ncbi:GH35 family beta-galactosidase [Jiulongibacter sp. NS-SX5]|uniref:GH35 family beta-galactosidase n=1 Tax=Jiulongibacter sp. NS-SX5 TaxID=3463854 RepID=UPI00405887D2